MSMRDDEMPDLLAHSFLFANQGLSVSYRASEAPQQLSISVRVKEKSRRLKADVLFWIALIADVGLIGGAEFPPGQGTMRVITDFGTPEGRQFDGILEVSAMSPWFVRNLINFLVRCAEIETMSITGTVVPTGDNLSVDTPTMLRWLGNRTDAYIGRWSDLGFEVKESSLPGKMNMKLHLRAEVTSEQCGLVDLLLSEWCIALALYPRRDKFTWGGMQVDQRIARTKREIRVGKREFDYIPGPAANLLLNGLAALNRRGHTDRHTGKLVMLPIESVELAL